MTESARLLFEEEPTVPDVLGSESGGSSVEGRRRRVTSENEGQRVGPLFGV